jgi:hypothetical protein
LLQILFYEIGQSIRSMAKVWQRWKFIGDNKFFVTTNFEAHEAYSILAPLAENVSALTLQLKPNFVYSNMVLYLFVKMAQIQN